MWSWDTNAQEGRMQYKSSIWLRLCTALCSMVVLLWSCSVSQNAGEQTRGSIKSGYNPTNDVQQLLEALEPGKAREYFIQGSILQMQKRYAEAIIEFQQALRYDNSPALHYALAVNYHELSKHELATEHLRTAIAIDNTFMPAYYLLGEVYISRFQLDEAIEVYTQILEREHSTIARFTLARIYEFRNADTAIAMYNAMLDTEEDYTVLERLAELYEQRGDTAKAIGILERLYTLLPDNENIPPILMYRYLQQQQYDKSFELLGTVGHTLPADAVPRYYLAVGNSLLEALDSPKIGSKEYAAKFIGDTEHTFPNEWRIHLMRGMLAFSLGDTALCTRLVNETLVRADSLPDVPLQMAAFYLQQQYFSGVEEVTKRYEKRFANDARFPFFAALALLREQKQALGIEALHRALRADSTYIDAWLQLGIEYSTMEKPELSDEAYLKVLQLDPENPLANNNYAYALSERGEQLEMAKTMATTALQGEPNNPSYLDTMGWIYFQLGDYEQALLYIQKAIDNGDASATVYEHLGDTYQKLGQIDNALQAWKSAVEHDPQRQSTQQRINTYK